MSAVVCNASPLIVLAKAELLDVLPGFRHAVPVVARAGLYLQPALIEGIAQELGE